jgi:hypothetical protein
VEAVEQTIKVNKHPLGEFGIILGLDLDVDKQYSRIAVGSEMDFESAVSYASSPVAVLGEFE